ncbi:MAG TPA: LicD family protein [Candidatus Blautia faecigallinarum]|uniref:LicD family protein n=1 Tax=Candidatus Blautia faecigallinarum TaxID=2838488 RepID=A0A9D2DQH2_9FIRM|nr:LicD family protein [Candidatus Blautia faecigallinarum]
MTEKQKHLLKLFREIDEICKEHGLRYVMAGGTLIGVVRNEGFIPWDDDVDIYMPRDDWNRFVELSKTEFPPDRAVQCVDVDRSYTNSFPRYADTSSCAIHKHQVIGNDKAGEIIDVLTLDPIPADDKEYEKYRTYMMIYSDLVNLSVVFGNRWEVPALLYLKYVLSCIFLGRDRTLKKLEKILFSYKEEDCPRYAMRWGGCPFLFDKDMFFPVKYGDFEGEKVMIPRRTSDYLIWHYGDEWSYIPPHGERESHDAICVEGIDYKEFRSDYMGQVKPRKAKMNAVVRKFYYMASAKRANKLTHKRDVLQGRSTVLDLKARIRECPKSLQELMAAYDFDTLNEIFINYYQVQLSAAFIGREDFANIYPFYHPTLLEVEDEVFWAAMYTLFYTERISKVFRMFQVREKLGHLTGEMKGMREDILLFRKAACHYEMGEIQEAREIAGSLLEKYPKNPSFLKFQCRLLMDEARENGSTGKARSFLREACSLFPEDGYFLKYQADILWMEGERVKALGMYADAREKTNNGIVHLEIEKMMKKQKKEALAFCEELLGVRKRQEAQKWMELMSRLLPEDEEVREYLSLTRVYTAGSQAELEEVVDEIRDVLENAEDVPDKKERPKETDVYRRALTQAWKRLGYPEELAGYRTELIYTEDQADLEWLLEEIRGYKIRDKAKSGQAYKLIGDVRRKQGQTDQAFENYKKALECAGHSYVKKEVARIFLSDLYRGGRKLSQYAKRGDASEFMDAWLKKYGSIEELKQLVGTLL